MTYEDAMNYKNNAVKILKKNDQHATANAVEIAFRALLLMEQYRLERDIAIEQLEELGISFGANVDDYECITKDFYHELIGYKNKFLTIDKVVNQ